jgi:hypothetical protein
MRIATSAIQCCWQLLPDGARKVLPLQCHACGCRLTLLHLSAYAGDLILLDS